MSVINSLSKGIFVFKNGMNGKLTGRKSNGFQIPQRPLEFSSSSHLWNYEFEKSWARIQHKVDAIQTSINNDGLRDLVECVEKSYAADEDVLGSIYMPVAALLTGINKPDHHQYFETLSNQLTHKRKSYTTILPARDCSSVKAAIETLVSCILGNGKVGVFRDDENEVVECHADEEDEGQTESESENEPPIKLKRTQYTLDVLQCWYSSRHQNESTRPKISVIIPNFEEFKPSVIRDLILVLSNHCHKLPFVLILGVATTTEAIFHTLSFNETTRIKLHAFSSQSPMQIIDRIIDEIILSPLTAFHLSGKVFSYLINVFLSYDLTVKEFVRSIRFCMLSHYSEGDAYAICAQSYQRRQKYFSKLSKETIDSIRRLPSFRPYVEAMTIPADIIAILTDDEYFVNAFGPLICNVEIYFMKFHCFIRMLLVMVRDLPQSPLGKQLHEIYTACSDQVVVDSEAFKKCWQYLEFMSRNEMIILIQKCQSEIKEFLQVFCHEKNVEINPYVRNEMRKCANGIIEDLNQHIDGLTQSSVSAKPINCIESTSPDDLQAVTSRHEWQQKLLEKAQQTRAENADDIRKVLNYLRDSVIAKCVVPVSKAPTFTELFVFSNFNEVQAHLKGAPRGAIHNALANPQHYLQCDCCILDDPGALRSTMPDIAIAYKLLQEAGQHVNIFDWMQAFRTIVDEGCEDNNIPPLIQARFTRARAELQFLGFIKGSKRKTDHVIRATW